MKRSTSETSGNTRISAPSIYAGYVAQKPHSVLGALASNASTSVRTFDRADLLKNE